MLNYAVYVALVVMLLGLAQSPQFVELLLGVDRPGQHSRVAGLLFDDGLRRIAEFSPCFAGLSFLAIQAPAPTSHRLRINPLEPGGREQLLRHPVGVVRDQLPDRPRFHLANDLQDPGRMEFNLSAYAPQRIALDLVENINPYVAFTWLLDVVRRFSAHKLSARRLFARLTSKFWFRRRKTCARVKGQMGLRMPLVMMSGRPVPRRLHLNLPAVMRFSVKRAIIGLRSDLHCRRQQRQ